MHTSYTVWSVYTIVSEWLEWERKSETICTFIDTLNLPDGGTKANKTFQNKVK